ncbi:MAG: hypothetical protein AAGD38_04245 [Acidobacteriota bacterium]
MTRTGLFKRGLFGKQRRDDTPEPQPRDEAGDPMLFPYHRGHAPSSAAQARAYADLLESLRALAGSGNVPSVVIAGVASVDALASVIDGLEDQSLARGLEVFFAQLVATDGRRLLRPYHATGVEHLTFAGAPQPDQVRRWVLDASTERDLVVIAAPPLVDAVDAVLLARACDGLVLVVEASRTRREDLEAALDRIRTGECTVLGLVMEKNRRWLPRFLHKLFTGPPRAVRTRED